MLNYFMQYALYIHTYIHTYTLYTHTHTHSEQLFTNKFSGNNIAVIIFRTPLTIFCALYVFINMGFS
jgi:hypothetical protein